MHASMGSGVGAGHCPAALRNLTASLFVSPCRHAALQAAAFKPAGLRGGGGPSLCPSVRCAAVAGALAVRSPRPARSEIINPSDPTNNVSDYIYDKMGTNLHLQPDHPLGIIKQAIYDYFDRQHQASFSKHDNMPPVVSVKANFDDMLVPADHVSRSSNDTYYVSADKVLRCHTSAHQSELLRQKVPAFLVTGDVYRRDSIDATHYPVFHQMEGVRIFSEQDWLASGMSATDFASKDLKATLEGMAKHLFGNVECRWIDAYFPFTEPSYELEIFFNGKWLEVLGCGVMQQQILDGNFGEPGRRAWAFGLGLERLAMVLFDVPDIRLFWSGDDRFLKQFRAGDLKARFKSYSKYPSCWKDVVRSSRVEGWRGGAGGVR